MQKAAGTVGPPSGQANAKAKARARPGTGQVKQRATTQKPNTKQLKRPWQRLLGARVTGGREGRGGSTYKEKSHRHRQFKHMQRPASRLAHLSLCLSLPLALALPLPTPLPIWACLVSLI